MLLFGFRSITILKVHVFIMKKKTVLKKDKKKNKHFCTICNKVCMNKYLLEFHKYENTRKNFTTIRNNQKML